MGDADIIAGIVALLRADPEIGGVGGAEIYGTEMPFNVVSRMPIKAVVVEATGGPPLTEESDAQLDHQRFDVKCYGPTPHQANELRRKCAKRLVATKRQVWARTLIHWINRGGGFYTARDVDGLWPFSFQSFQTLYSTQEVL